MRNLSALILVIFLFSSCSGPRTQEELGKEVLQAYIDDNHRALKQLYVKQMDIENLIAESSMPEGMKRNAKQDLRAKTAFFKLINKLVFNSSRFRAYENGVNWQDVQFIKVTASETDYSFFNFSASFMKEYGIQVADIDVEFESAGETFILHLDDCIETQRGWCLTEDVRFRRKH